MQCLLALRYPGIALRLLEHVLWTIVVRIRNTCVLTIGILAERPVGLHVWQTLCTLSSMYTMQPAVDLGRLKVPLGCTI